MKMQVNVLTVSRYSIDDEKTGKKVVGTKIMYEGSQADSDTKKGLEILQINSDRYDTFDCFSQVPAKYEIDVDLVPGKNGQVKMVYKNSKLVA